MTPAPKRNRHYLKAKPEKYRVYKRKCNRKYLKAHPEKRRKYKSKCIDLGKIKARAKKYGVPFGLTPRDIGPIPAECPIFGIPLQSGIGHSCPNSPTIDRLDPQKGYIKGNVAWISNLANILKSSATADQHRRIADWMDEMMRLQAT